MFSRIALKSGAGSQQERKVKKIIIYLIAVLASLYPARGFCEDAMIEAVKVIPASNLKVSFHVKDAFSRDIEEAIKSGIPTSFKFKVEVNRINSVWFNEGLSSYEFRHTVKYDNLREEYDISLEETNEKGLRTKDINEMKRLMATGNSVAVPLARPVSNGEEYEVRIMAELHTVELPFLLDYMLFFVKIWDFKTDWYVYRFAM